MLTSMMALSASTAPYSFPACPGISNIPINAPLPAAADFFYVPLNVSYMNTATLGPMPRPALSCAVRAWEEFESDPVNLYPWASSGQELDAVRSKAAEVSCFGAALMIRFIFISPLSDARLRIG